MRFFLLLGVLILLAASVSALTQPLISMNSSFFDLSINDVWLYFNFSTDEANGTINYTLFLDAVKYQDVFSSPLEIIAVAGNHSVYLCAYVGNLSNCSSAVSFDVVTSTKPIISEFPSMMSIIPSYGDFLESRRIFGITIEDPHPVNLMVSFIPSDEDIYGDDFENVTKVDCVERALLSNKHYFNCTFIASYKMQAGFYDMIIYANNSYNSVSKTIGDELMIYTLLSANVSKPMLNFNSTYGGWVDADPPIVIENQGNVVFSRVYLTTRAIECSSYTFPVESIFAGIRDNKAAAGICLNETEFELKINRIESEELYIFVNNEDERSPGNCKYRWDVRVKYLFEV